MLVAKLYANTIYMVLNSRFQIIGGRDTYDSSTDVSFTTTMMRDIISQSTEGTRPAEEIQGQAPVVTISNEIFNDNYEVGSNKRQSLCFMCLLRTDSPPRINQRTTVQSSLRK